MTTESTPKTLVTNQKLPPIAYQIQLRSTFCRGCNTTHEYSETFELRIYRNFKNLTPVRTMADVVYDMPINVVRSNPTITPFCHECVKPGMLSHLPKPPRADFAIVAGYTPPAEAKPQPKVKKTDSKSYTLDDLGL